MREFLLSFPVTYCIIKRCVVLFNISFYTLRSVPRKHYWFIAIALITMISFSSCESDEERGFDISGLYGKTWWGEMGFEDPYGERLYSYITFTSGAFPDHGVGTEERCYYDDELYRVYKFDWEIQNGWLYLYYSDGYTFIIEYPSVSGRYFYGTAEDGFEIRLEWVDGRSIRKKVS